MILENCTIINFSKKRSKKSKKIFYEIEFLHNGKEWKVYCFNEDIETKIKENDIKTLDIENENGYYVLKGIIELNIKDYLCKKVTLGILKYYKPTELNNFDEEELKYLERIIKNSQKYLTKFSNLIQEYLQHNFTIDLNLIPEFKNKELTLEDFKYYLKKYVEVLKKEKQIEQIKKIQKGEKISETDIEDDIEEFNPFKYSIKNILKETQGYLYQYKGKNVLGVPWGIENLDEKVEGIFGLVALTGAPGFGKTTLATEVVNYNIFNTKNRIIYLSLEISSDMLIVKLAGQKIGIPFKKILKDYLNYEEANKLYDYIEEILDLPDDRLFIIDKKGNPTFNKINQLIKYLLKNKEKEEEILIVLDYLNLFNEFSNITDKNEKVAQQIREIMDIKNKTKTNWLIIVAKNKQGYKQADLASIKGTNEQEYALETIISLEDPLNINKDIDTSKINVIATIIKSRWGESKINIPLYFDGKKQHFKSVKMEELKE